MYSSEALKKGIVPPKPVDQMTEEEIKAWCDELDPDNMGFDGTEGMPEEAEICP